MAPFAFLDRSGAGKDSRGEDGKQNRAQRMPLLWRGLRHRHAGRRQGRVVKVVGDKTHPTNFGRLCTKGTTCAQAIAESGRMENAYLRQARSQDPSRIAMDKAISETAQRLRDTRRAWPGCAVVLRVGADVARGAVPDQQAGQRLRPHQQHRFQFAAVHGQRGQRLQALLGADGPPGSYEDFDHADCFS
jgi:sulfite reductase (NADPH) flavoprotein alpha-component